MGKNPKRARYMIHMDEDDEPDTMSAKAGGGQANAGAIHESIEPEKKLLKSNRSNIISFSHFYRNWFEIDTGLFCVPSQHSIQSMITQEMKKLIDKFVGNGTYVYVNVAVEPLKLSNFIVLSDNIKLEGGGVTEVSSFVQNSKLVHIKVREPDIGSAYAMYVSQLNDKNNRLYIPIEDISQSPTYNATNLITKMVYGPQRNTDYDLEDIGIFGFKEQSIAGMNKVISRNNNSVLGIFDYSVALTGGKDHSELAVYNQNDLINWNIQNQLKDYELSIIDATDCIYTCKPSYAPVVWSTNSPYSADKILSATQLPTYTSGITADGQKVLSPLVWQPKTKNFGGYIKEDAGQPIQAIKRLAGNKNNSKCHDYLTMIPIRKSDGQRMKLRASVMIETSMHVSFFFRERALHDAAIDINEMNDWMEIVGGAHHEAEPNMKGITKGLGMMHFNF